MAFSASGLPFDDIRNLFDEMPGPDEHAAEDIREREAQLTKPAGSLGQLESLAEWMGTWQGRSRPTVTRPLIAVFAASHGIAARGVSAFPPEVTHQMVQNFASGGAAVNQLCTTYELGLKVFELALDYPTGDIVETDAMDEKGCAATIAYGMEAISGGIDLVGLGEMGIGNTAVAAAIFHALYGGEAADWVGRGTGVDDAGLTRKAEAVAAAVGRIGSTRDPLEILRRLGGREIAAMVGTIIAGRMERVPVIVDGFVTTAAAAIVHAMRPDAIDHCLFAHCSAEAAHGAVLQRLGRKPLLDLGLRLGEGTGAAIAASIVRAAVATHAGMATFGDAGVAEKGSEPRPPTTH
ncbi:nicotinate-nucleotide-dimethylbenzimidazole phosphoribosyltransferase [Faunimonas pinastri]|uniref:Nicotinate-nucleotide--dimethylbenzimidazole phosphoribosyltransferase n=1 Tax=Faunimonas pinastri TaxID=1855383 RepID=A0A1H9JHM4_9HYPH|nr:nicotinate-nucleotide--dimethylbenzimidazole phosphoribosyltransferase [Faunimonas pinastri]SEQ86258.1 nicotinate-nucleotide-dimethylbenzimidazole phosphoribosyltransferase [Faunimonas pinastri]